MTYDFVEYGILYRNYLKIPKRSWRGKDYVHDVRKSNRAVPILVPIRCKRTYKFKIVFECRYGTVR